MASRRAVTNQMATKYRQATRPEKTQILDQFVELTDLTSLYRDGILWVQVWVRARLWGPQRRWRLVTMVGPSWA